MDLQKNVKKKLFVIHSFKFYFQKYLCNNIDRWTSCKRKFCIQLLNSEHKIKCSQIIHNHDKDDEQKLKRQ